MAVPAAVPVSLGILVCASAVALSMVPSKARDVSAGPSAATAVANDNRTPAGVWQGDTLVLRLVAQEAVWHLHDEKDGAFHVPAFAEEGKPASIPGPLLRVRAGTPVRVIVRNEIADTLFVRGLTARARLREDSLIVVPGATAETRFIAEGEGTYFYWASATASPVPRRNRSTATDRTSQLTGAFIVDPAGSTRTPADRVFVITELFDSPNHVAVQDSRGLFLRDFVALNGKSWPHTERLAYQVGDTIRWRIVNAADAPHAMHLHGFYYRVASIGSNAGDSVFPATEPRMVVTEQLPIGRTMNMEWVPERAGGWIFHCHMTPHIARHAPIGNKDVLAFPTDHPHGDDDDHLTTGMNGLLLATRVTGPAAPRTEPPPTRQLRLFVHSDSAAGDSVRRFGYVLQRGRTEPARDSLETVSPILFVHRNEPTSIEVVNRTSESTAVHWHGIELESYFDGVVGFGGLPNRLTPAIRPGTSFTARMTPPRAGTFMYHTHFSELRQQFGGLAGALIVLEPGEQWDNERERIFVIADAPQGGTTLNGSRAPAPIELRVGTTYRMRIANIAADRPALRVYLMRDTVEYATWRPIAKDGWKLTGASAAPRPSWQRVGTGETADFAFTPDAPGDYTLELRPGSAITGNPDRTRPLILSQILRARR